HFDSILFVTPVLLLMRSPSEIHSRRVIFAPAAALALGMKPVLPRRPQRARTHSNAPTCPPLKASLAASRQMAVLRALSNILSRKERLTSRISRSLEADTRCLSPVATRPS